MVILTAGEGKLLKNGNDHANNVYLGKNDSGDEWVEVDESDIDEVEECEEPNTDVGF